MSMTITECSRHEEIYIRDDHHGSVAQDPDNSGHPPRFAVAPAVEAQLDGRRATAARLDHEQLAAFSGRQRPGLQEEKHRATVGAQEEE